MTVNLSACSECGRVYANWSWSEIANGQLEFRESDHRCETHPDAPMKAIELEGSDDEGGATYANVHFHMEGPK